MKTYFDGFSDINDVKKQFSDQDSYKYNEDGVYSENSNQGSDIDLDNVEWIFAVYTYECYSGEAFVLFKQNGTIYENNGGHCSCYGLEGQWGPEATTLEAIKDRLNNGLGKNYHDENNYNTALAKFIEELENAN